MKPIIADIWTNVNPWLMSRKRLVETVQRDTRIIEQLGDEVVRMSVHHDGLRSSARRAEALHRERDAAVAECERLRARLAEVTS